MKFDKQEIHDELMRYVGKIEAIGLIVDDLESIDYDAITEEEYDELITQPGNLISMAGDIIEKYAKELVK